MKDMKKWASASALGSAFALMVVPNIIHAEEMDEAPVTNVAVEETMEPVTENSAPIESNDLVESDRQTEVENTTDFNNIGIAEFNVNEEESSITIGNSGGDHFAMYNGLEEKTNDFVLEADLRFEPTNNNGNNSAGLVFGTSSKTHPGTYWYAANVDYSRMDRPDLFRVFGAGHDIITTQGSIRDIDLNQPLHLKLDVSADGTLVYSFGNSGSHLYTMSTVISNWQGGYVGLLSFVSEATFYNIHFIDRMDHSQVIGPSGQDLPLGPEYHTNLEDTKYVGGSWVIDDTGLHSDARDVGDTFVYSGVQGQDFVYSTDITFHSPQGAAGLLFRSNNDPSGKEAYAINIDGGSHRVKLWRWFDNDALQLIDEKEVAAKDTYTLKVVAIGSWIQYYVDDVLVASLGDYTLQRDDRGQPTYIDAGLFGLLNWNGDVSFQNTYYQTIDEFFNPVVTDVSVKANQGQAEPASQWNPTEPIRIQYVNNDVETISIHAQTWNPDAKITVYDSNGDRIENIQAIPVQTGINWFQIVSTLISDTGQQVSASYRINVHKFQPDAVYGNEKYRDQYHYSVKEGWANDPNGMVYYNGTYHFFYQFYDDTRWGPMHWAHATSTDLIHWTDQPIAFYPDANGTMFSGCIVVDDKNTSGLFETGQGGLVALITCDGNGQRIKLAYSTDEGRTWNKVEEIAADWYYDPLMDSAFRDPKVFRWADQWFMVIAGGPLRIYSSPDLRNWKLETAYPSLHTECPDLYPIQTDKGIKWVLSRGGRTYKVGDFTNDTGSWRFVPDTYYENYDGIMNFGKDSYAAMTFYVHDFGTPQNPTLPDIIEINWMNTWDDYCNLVADTLGQAFNGTFNLPLKVGLIEDGNGNWLLTQTPVEQLETIRENKLVNLQKTEVTESNNLLDDIKSDTYEIIATFYPGEGTTQFGFKLRKSTQSTAENTGGGRRKLRAARQEQETLIYYDMATGRLYIDRSRSGVILSNRFAEVDSQVVTRNADGSLTLRIFVDRASVEVFTGDYTAAGANQIFPDPGSLYASVYALGDPVIADIEVYSLKRTIFIEKQEGPAIEDPSEQTDTITKEHQGSIMEQGSIMDEKEIKPLQPRQNGSVNTGAGSMAGIHIGAFFTSLVGFFFVGKRRK